MNNLICLSYKQKRYILGLLKEIYNKSDSPNKLRLRGIIIRIINSMKARERHLFRNWASAFFGIDFEKLTIMLKERNKRDNVKKKE